MKRLSLALLALTITSPALAADPLPAGTSTIGASRQITVAQAIPLATALRNLDGHMLVVKQNGADAVIMTPWDFADGKLRLRIASNINIVEAAVKTSQDAQQAIFQEVSKKAKVTELKPGTPEYEDYQRQVNELMAQPAPGTGDLSRIKASELKLDRNEIPVTVLSALGPILDIDIALK